MEWYKAYFREEMRERSYLSNPEAMVDVRAMVDVCLNLMFDGRDAEGERLDMRGVVITPQEFGDALRDWTLDARRCKNQKEIHETMRKEMSLVLKHIQMRIQKSKEAGRLPEIYALIERLELNGPEAFCFCLSVVCDYDRKYERLYGYLQDNIAARLPTVGLGISLYEKTINPQANGQEIWLRGNSPLWKYLLKDSPPEAGESKLSRPMSVRDVVIAYLTGEVEVEAVLQQEADMECASRVRLVYEWDDLIIEESQKQLLHQICARIHYRDVVMEQWGFGRKLPYGSGVSAIFYGSPGTGKTMAAQVLGKVMKKEVYRVDISRLTSKYIGETEKNLGRLFDKAQEYGWILFFDEADGLFAKRSAISTSNDRYANMETGYLLQRFEEFEGIAILATNFINNMDEAFKRRIKFFVRFTFPNREMRLKLWQSMIPSEARLDEPLQYSFFASGFELPGSDIKEIITNSAYLAASEGKGIRNEHIRRALQSHYQKMGKKLTAEEVGL